MTDATRPPVRLPIARHHPRFSAAARRWGGLFAEAVLILNIVVWGALLLRMGAAQ